MKLTIRKNGREVAPNEAVRALKNTPKALKAYVRASAHEAACEALSVLRMAISGEEGYGENPYGTGFDDTMDREEYSGATGEADRVQTGHMLESMRLYKTNAGFAAGARSAPEYYFAQDEGWTESDKPDGAAWDRVQGMRGLSHAYQAAIAVLDDALTEPKLAQAADGSYFCPAYDDAEDYF